MKNITGNNVPRVNAMKALKIYRNMHNAMQLGIIVSCHDCSDGGLAVALAESSIAGMLGINIDLSLVPYKGKRRNDYVLFSETASRFIVTISPDKKRKFEKIMAGNIIGLIGTVINDDLLEVRGFEGKLIIREKISALKSSWQKTLNF
jgi:phosphoribosylformylglycinamidine synthase